MNKLAIKTIIYLSVLVSAFSVNAKNGQNSWIQNEFSNIKYIKIQQQCADWVNEKNYREIENYLAKYDKPSDTTDTIDLNGENVISFCVFGAATKTTLQARENWITASLKTPYPIIIAQAAELPHFFEVRGGNFVSEIDPVQLKKAYSILNNAGEKLDKSQKSSRTPLWYQVRLQLAVYQNDPQQFLALIEKAIKTYPNNKNIYRNATGNLRPEWGYPFELLEGIAQIATVKSKSRETSYADIYMNYVIFNQSRTSHNLVQAQVFQPSVFLKGARSILKEYPSNYTYNRLGLAACRLQLKELANEMFEKIETYATDIWPGENYARCYAWAKQK